MLSLSCKFLSSVGPSFHERTIQRVDSAWRSFSVSCRQRQFHLHFRAVSERAAHIYFPVVRRDNCLYDRKAKPCSTCGSRPCFVGAIKTLKYMWERLWRNADTVVGNGKRGAIPMRANSQFNMPAVWCVFDGVVEKIDEDLLQSERITPHSCARLNGVVDRNIFFIGEQPHLLSGGIGKHSQVQIASLNAGLSGV